VLAQWRRQCRFDPTATTHRAKSASRDIVVEDHFQRQAHRLVAVTRKLHQQAVRSVELEPPTGRGAELLEGGAFEVVPRDRFSQFGEQGFDAVGVKALRRCRLG